MGSLAHNASSGKTIIRRICKKEGKKFIVQNTEPLMVNSAEYEKVANDRAYANPGLDHRY